MRRRSAAGLRDQASAMTQGVLDAWQGFADARVVHNAAIVERDVEVDAHEDAVIVQREIANGKLGHGVPVVGRWSLVISRSALIVGAPFVVGCPRFAIRRAGLATGEQ